MEYKGLYYFSILHIMGVQVVNGVIINSGIKYMYEYQIKGIYHILQKTFPEKPILKDEFISSMTWVLADLFGNGSEVEVSEHAYDFIQ